MAQHKWYVVNVQTISIDSGWETMREASERAFDLNKETGTPTKVMTKPAVGGQKLDPNDQASWNPRRQRNPGRPSMKENPGELLIVNGAEPDSAKAEKVFETWHKKPARNVSIFRPGVDGDDNMICIGCANDVTYRSGKWQKGRKTEDYCHTFDSKPKVWMLAHLVEPGLKRNGSESGCKSVESLLAKTRNADGQFAVADLASPLSFTVDGEDGPEEIAIHAGARVYGGVDQKTIIIADPHWKLIVVRGGKMHFDERGIVM